MISAGFDIPITLGLGLQCYRHEIVLVGQGNKAYHCRLHQFLYSPCVWLRDTESFLDWIRCLRVPRVRNIRCVIYPNFLQTRMVYPRVLNNFVSTAELKLSRASVSLSTRQLELRQLYRATMSEFFGSRESCNNLRFDYGTHAL